MGPWSSTDLQLAPVGNYIPINGQKTSWYLPLLTFRLEAILTAATIRLVALCALSARSGHIYNRISAKYVVKASIEMLHRLNRDEYWGLRWNMRRKFNQRGRSQVNSKSCNHIKTFFNGGLGLLIINTRNVWESLVRESFTSESGQVLFTAIGTAREFWMSAWGKLTRYTLNALHSLLYLEGS